MKKFCFILVILLIMTMFVMGVNAASFEDELSEKFFDYCGGNALDWSDSYLSKIDPKVKIYEYTQTDDMVFFSAEPCWMEPEDMEQTKVFDKWSIYSPHTTHPSVFSLYVKIGEDIYSIEEAWETGLVTDLTSIEDFSEYKFTTVTRIDNANDETEPTTEKVEPTTETADATTETAQPTDPSETVQPTTETIELTTGNSEHTEPKKTVKKTTAKKKNPIKVTVKTKTVKAKKLKKGKVTVKAVTVKKAKGEVKYSKVSGSKKLTVNKTTGKIKIKKGTQKGNYTIKVEVTARGNNKYKSKTIIKKVKIKVK